MTITTSINMAEVKGQNLRILAGSSASTLKCIAAAKSCLLRVNATAESTGSKDDNSDWDTKEITKIDWELTADALVTTDTDTTGMQIEDLTVGDTYTLRFSRTNGSNNRNTVADRIQTTGKAILIDLQVNSQNGTSSTYTAKFIGSGELTQYSEPATT